MQTIKVGLVGYGFAGATFHAPVIADVAALELVAVASSKPAAVHANWPQARVVADPAQLFADPDIELVVIAAPNDAHFALAQAALTAGKHVVVDKPFTITSAEAGTLIALAKQHHLVLSVYHNRRWDADFQTLRQLLAEGRLGRIVSFTSHFDRYRPEIRQRWREQADAGGGLLYDLGPHMIDQALTLFGMPDSLFADVAYQRDGAAAVDYFHLLLHYGQMRVVLHASALAMAATPRYLVQGEKGSFVKFGLDTQEDALRAGGHPAQAGWGEDPVKGVLQLAKDAWQISSEVPMQPGAYQRYYEGIADAIRTGSAPPVSAEDGLATIRMIEAALHSVAQGRVITF